MAGAESLAELRVELEALVSRLDDLILFELSEAVERGERERPPLERRMTRARNALERARALLEEG